MENEKIIETDLDTEVEDKNDGGLYPYDPGYENIEIGDVPFSIFEYLRQLDKGKIQIQPDFQRNLVWRKNQKSRFIESIILNFPLPPIYLNETKDSNYIVIDGLQRSTALKQFYNNEFELEGLEALPKYNGCSFAKLPEQLKSKFEDKKLTVFVLKPSTPMVVIYDLFNRINTGGTQLNKQEIRNCIFIGPSTRLLRELAEENCFKRAIDWGVKDTRMKDREVVLRYLSFRWFNYQSEYTGDMSEYVESAMRKINGLDEGNIEMMRRDFRFVMTASFDIWGDRNFRIPTDQTRGTINTAVLETVCCYLSSLSYQDIENNKSIIRDNYSRLIENPDYIEAVSRSTGNRNKVVDRFRIAYEVLNHDML